MKWLRERTKLCLQRECMKIVIERGEERGCLKSYLAINQKSLVIWAFAPSFHKVATPKSKCKDAPAVNKI